MKMHTTNVIKALAIAAANYSTGMIPVQLDGMTPEIADVTWGLLRKRDTVWEVVSSELVSIGKPVWKSISEKSIQEHVVVVTAGNVEYENENAKEVLYVTHCVDDYPMFNKYGGYDYQLVA